MHEKEIISTGKPLTEGGKVLIMLHGRGAAAEDILSIESYLEVDDFTILAPQATNKAWYPYSFLEKPQKNEPWLTSALQLISGIILDLNEKHILTENIYFLGFSQGACLSLEYTARNAKKYGGIVAFSGGLIGDRIYMENYQGDFENTPVFVGSSDPDPHIPVERVKESSEILKNLEANVNLKIYKNLGHTINKDEIDQVNSFIFQRTHV